MRATIVLPALLLISLAASAAEAPRNVILIIGDGVGPAHVTWMRQLRGAEFQAGRMRLVALLNTVSADRAVTDSAAAASAYATGMKSNYRALSIAPDGTARRTVLQAARANGKATGLVTTTLICDATPAAFAAHAVDRYEAKTVCPQVIRAGADVLAGGGIEVFGKKEVPPIESLASEAGYTTITTKEGLAAAGRGKALVLYETQEQDGDHPDFPLPVLARFALDRLDDDPDGFFLLIEQEGTDTGSHRNDAEEVERSLRSLDEAIGVALGFAETHPGTLVLFTGDHETGGLRLTGRDKLRAEWSTVEHTGSALPLFAYGPGAGHLGSFIENTEVGALLLDLVARPVAEAPRR